MTRANAIARRGAWLGMIAVLLAAAGLLALTRRGNAPPARGSAGGGDAGAPAAPRPVQNPQEALESGEAHLPRDWTVSPEVDAHEREPAALRIVCASPSGAEICCALGLRDAIVGRSDYTDHPPGIERVPIVGDVRSVSAEWLLELKPDLALISGGSVLLRSAFERVGVRVLALSDDGLEDVFSAVARVGAATGRSRTAERLVAGIRADLDAVARRFAGSPSRRVLVVIYPLSTPPTPPIAACNGSYLGDLLERAGHVNAAGAAKSTFAPLSLEAVLAADPDVIVELDPDARRRNDAEARAAWGAIGPLRAVSSGRVRVIAGRAPHIPGPRIAFTFLQLCRALADAGD